MPHRKHPRGVCAECGTDSALRADGTPYRHYAPRRGDGDPLYCAGSARAAAHVKPPPRVRWRIINPESGFPARGSLWIREHYCGVVSHETAASIADAVGLPLEDA